MAEKLQFFRRPAVRARAVASLADRLAQDQRGRVLKVRGIGVGVGVIKHSIHKDQISGGSGTGGLPLPCHMMPAPVTGGD